MLILFSRPREDFKILKEENLRVWICTDPSLKVCNAVSVCFWVTATLLCLFSRTAYGKSPSLGQAVNKSFDHYNLTLDFNKLLNGRQTFYYLIPRLQVWEWALDNAREKQKWVAKFNISLFITAYNDEKTLPAVRERRIKKEISYKGPGPTTISSFHLCPIEDTQNLKLSVKTETCFSFINQSSYIFIQMYIHMRIYVPV